MSRDKSKTTNIPWWIGVSQKVKPCGYAMTGGFDWGGLYQIYNRCSCWCCPLQRIGG